MLSDVLEIVKRGSHSSKCGRHPKSINSLVDSLGTLLQASSKLSLIDHSPAKSQDFQTICKSQHNLNKQDLNFLFKITNRCKADKFIVKDICTLEILIDNCYEKSEISAKLLLVRIPEWFHYSSFSKFVNLSKKEITSGTAHFTTQLYL